MLDAARSASDDMRAKAAESSARLIREATDDAARMRQEAAEVLTTKTREAEVEARERVAKGGAWADQNGNAPKPFTDAELAQLAESLEAVDPAEAGIDVRPAEPRKRRRFLG